MNFSQESNVTIVLTSCGRFDLLKKTLDSLDTFNTYPVREVIITEDSGSEKVHDAIPEHWKPYCKVFVNSTNLGQLASIDLAYQHVKTEYIFHCEDDWEFYRHRFIEDSMKILESDPNVLQAWLRSYHHDIRVNSLLKDGKECCHTLGAYQTIDHTGFFRLLNNHKNWQGFSFNPGLRRLSDYDFVKPFSQYRLSAEGESKTSIKYASIGKYAVILENSAVMHIGWADHVVDDAEKRRDRQKRVKRIVLGLAGFSTGILIGFFLGWLAL